MRVLTAEQMRRFDRWAISEIGIPSLVLMENAALGVADAIGERFPEAEEVLLLCGPGNNGGDGLALARHLHGRGYRCRVWLAVEARQLVGDAAAQLGFLRRLGVPVHEMAEADFVTLPQAEVVVDALFGTGLSRPLEGGYGTLVDTISAHEAPVVAVDLPSGLDASSGAPIGPHVRADVTVTFARPKLAHVLDPAARAVGEVVVADLGVPWVDLEGNGAGCWLLQAESLRGWLPARRPQSHKGDYGHLLLVAGSPGMSGAAVLAARAAVRAGAGLVTMAVPETIRAECHLGCLEAMTLSVANGLAAPLDGSRLEALLVAASRRSALAIGPGLGTDEEITVLVRDLVLGARVPTVLDADGLHPFAGRLEELAAREGDLVLTPHPGELARLLGVTTGEVQGDRLAAAREAAARSRAVVVLKGHQSLVAEPDGEVAINHTGNPGLATGGTGDVLTGVVGALLAQGLDPATAARLGVFVHGLAGDLVAADLGERSLSASDVAESLPAGFRAVEDGAT
ncbi:MAG TPA: NAD(P)H-hydrate dehydratase [Thermoanaerobaculia bacterium]|nr:NAD(P)H-hydrate dehydratase [Thermoanaerobaculia bacterium]